MTRKSFFVATHDYFMQSCSLAVKRTRSWIFFFMREMRTEKKLIAAMFLSRQKYETHWRYVNQMYIFRIIINTLDCCILKICPHASWAYILYLYVYCTCIIFTFFSNLSRDIRYICMTKTYLYCTKTYQKR